MITRGVLYRTRKTPLGWQEVRSREHNLPIIMMQLPTPMITRSVLYRTRKTPLGWQEVRRREHNLPIIMMQLPTPMITRGVLYRTRKTPLGWQEVRSREHNLPIIMMQLPTPMITRSVLYRTGQPPVLQPGKDLTGCEYDLSSITGYTMTGAWMLKGDGLFSSCQTSKCSRTSSIQHAPGKSCGRAGDISTHHWKVDLWKNRYFVQRKLSCAACTYGKVQGNIQK
jgi:hypothetical protein